MNGCHDDDDDGVGVGGGDDDDDDDDVDNGDDDYDDYNEETVLSSSAFKIAIYFAVQGGSNVRVCGRNPCV